MKLTCLRDQPAGPAHVLTLYLPLISLLCNFYVKMLWDRPFLDITSIFATSKHESVYSSYMGCNRYYWTKLYYLALGGALI